MATDSRELAEPTPDEDDSGASMKDWYDRSSLKGDFMVMIADQTEEEYLRRCPENKFCEFIDGVVYLHSNASNMRDPSEPESDPDDPTKDWYDRSSLVGDFMVMIPDQTEEEYIRRAPESRFCEYIDGIVYMPSPVDAWHQFEVHLLIFLLEGFASNRELGLILSGPTALCPRPDFYLEPDIFILPLGGEGQIHGWFCDPPAIFVVEILSKSTRSHDLKTKAALYREAGVIEIWFVDERDKVLIVHRRTDDGYDVERIESGAYASLALPGFWIDVSWLWARPRPNLMVCLQSILAGPPA
jgi:Uma2 family endonuclease